MAHAAKHENNFVEPSKVKMPAWRTALVILYTIYLLLWQFAAGKVKKLFMAKPTSVKK